MFDIGWSEIAVIAVVALIAIGPKELPGVLRMVGQWMGKARKMAAEFQGQFQEAMREAEMADLKKSFDEVKEAASGFTGGNLMTSLEKDVSKALDIDVLDKSAASVTETPAIEPPVAPTKPATSKIDALATSKIDALATSKIDALATSKIDALATSKIDALEAPIPETFTEADAHAAASQPLAIVQEAQQTQEAQQPAPQDTAPNAPDALKDAKAS
ncbi:Sec-independent protein translocase protein TatB [Bradyrhizobium erythrophlei]|uniref:Sec-independent protein translocase protein TatB n=1 Tax=Bradyrhizobium erythrophlei TaxID=1437360 RepID=A0A1M5RW78_9BRAD|nr:Sec-independent protein translocase protein TatB [Bradyrhizobium erythrophlei]SHH30572.1 sec-independent protein translocase protein TatB [Bradyrhizobium erythrophlei]